MSLRYFRGRVDLDKLSLEDLASAAGALATLERLSQTGVLTFESGSSRASSPRPDSPETSPTISPQQQEVLEVLKQVGHPMTGTDLLVTTGIKENSFSAVMTGLIKQGLISRETTRSPGKMGRARRSETTYRLISTQDKET